MERVVRQQQHLGGGDTLTARSPHDLDEHMKALAALQAGRGRSIADVIEEITGETPSEETVEAVLNRLRMAQESGEDVDIAALVQSISDFVDQWA